MRGGPKQSRMCFRYFDRKRPEIGKPETCSYRDELVLFSPPPPNSSLYPYSLVSSLMYHLQMSRTDTPKPKIITYSVSRNFVSLFGFVRWQQTT